MKVEDWVTVRKTEYTQPYVVELNTPADVLFLPSGLAFKLAHCILEAAREVEELNDE